MRKFKIGITWIAAGADPPGEDKSRAIVDF